MKVPEEVLSYFNLKGAREEVTPVRLQALTGKSTVALQDFDIYVMGKESGNPTPSYFTKLRIVEKAQARNNIQGFLGVRFLDGFGYFNVNMDSSIKIMRPIGIQKLITKDSASFKKRALIYITKDVLLPLHTTECFCRLPLMDDNKLKTVDKDCNARKREAYARTKAEKKKWTHVNREGMLKEHQRMMYNMLLPYRKNLPEDEFFVEFLTDILKGCRKLMNEFETDNEMENMDGVDKVDKLKRMFFRIYQDEDEDKCRLSDDNGSTGSSSNKKSKTRGDEKKICAINLTSLRAVSVKDITL